MRLRNSRRAFTLIELIVALAIIGLLIALLLPAVQAAREAARRAQCSNNLKQIALGLLNYETVHRSFPASSIHKTLTATVPAPGSAGKEGKGAGFSWMVSILPYIEQQAVYDMIDFKSTPYDGSQNHKMVAGTMIPIYRCPSYPGPRFSQAPEYPAESQALANYAGLGASHAASLYGTEKEPVGGKQHPNGVLGPGLWIQFGQIRDGASNTLLVCETREEKYAAWFDGTTASVVALAEQTSPKFEEVDADGGKTYQPKAGVASTLNYGDLKALPPKVYLPADKHSGKDAWVHGPSSRHPGIVQHAFCDGSVRAIADSIDTGVYMSLSTRAGGERVGADF